MNINTEFKNDEKNIKKIVTNIYSKHEIPEKIVGNIKRYSKKNCRKNNNTFYILLPKFLTAISVLIISFFILINYNNRTIIEMVEVQMIDPNYQTEYIMSNFLTEDELAFQYAIFTLF